MAGRKKYAIIVAGGSGTRIGVDIPKQFIKLGGKPLLQHTIEKFLSLSFPVGIIVVVSPEWKDYWKKYCSETGFLERYAIPSGGITRFHSVANALQYLPDETVVAVHDGVRPFPAVGVIRDCFEAARQTGAAIPVIPVVETIRHLEYKVQRSKTVPRDEYRLVQTPQAFDIQLHKRAYAQEYNDGFTDDASVVESLGHPITLVNGNRENIKITTPFDLTIAEALITSHP